SFRRVLLGVALLTSRRIPTVLSIVIDRRDRHQVREAVALAEGLGCNRIHFILPQPVPGSAARNSDLPPGEWWSVRREVEALAREPGRAAARQCGCARRVSVPAVCAQPGEARVDRTLCREPVGGSGGSGMNEVIP